MNIEICRICLRTDRDLKTTNRILIDYHDELTNFNIDIVRPLFCYECEHLLRKHYNFRNKCQRAAKLFQQWERLNEESKIPAQALYSHLPHSSTVTVGLRDTAKLFIFKHEQKKEPKPTLFIQEGLIIDNNANNQQTAETEQENVNAEQPPRRFSQRKRTIKNTTKDQQNDKPGQENDKPDQENDKPDQQNEEQDQQNNEPDKQNVKTDDIDIKTDDSDIDNPSEFDDPDDADYDIKDDIDSLDVLRNDPIDFYYNSVKIEESSETSKDEESTSKDEESTSKNEGNVKRKRKVNIDKDECENVDKPPPKKKAKISKKADKEELNYLIVHEPNKRKSKAKANDKTLERDKLTFEAERLKAELNNRFESCGELKTSDGVVIDKDYMMECVNRKMKEPTMELLWSRLRGKSTITPKTIKMLAFLQNRYRRLDKYEDVFDIEYFNTMDKVKEEFENRKNYPAFLGADYKCLICYQKFISEKCLGRHARWHKESSGAFMCEICQYRYPTEERLKHHFACFHQAVFKCKLCTYVTYNSENMDGHYSRHMNLKAKCDLCDKTLANKAILKFHIRTRHSALGPQLKICALCGKSFCEQWFRRHLLKHHGVAGGANPPIENGIPCETCNVSFPSEEIHLTHIRHVHPELYNEPVVKKRKKRAENKPKTSGTSGTSETKSDRKPREGRPLGLNGEWTCRVCSAVGKTWGKLAIHFEFEHPDLDMSSVYADTTATLCEICGKGLSNVYSLRDHMRIHTGDRPFACDICPKSFSRIIGLKGHRLTHFPKSKPCPYCGKMFRQTGNLLNHVRIHVNDRKYKCKVCGKGFLHRQALKEHFNGVHLHVRRVKRPARKAGADVDRNQIIEEQIIYTGSSEYE